jgi:anaerobic magnesium-protoporphyrin IX monomethyl ester cyclase
VYLLALASFHVNAKEPDEINICPHFENLIDMKILLATLHAKYSHASLALPCLAVYCQDIPEVAITIREWTVNEPREHILRLVMAEQAELIAFSCYIWNIEQVLRIAADIKKIAPHVHIVLGGPEVSFAIFDLMNDNPAVDFVIKGEGEDVFKQLLVTLMQPHSGARNASMAEISNLFYRDGSDIASGPLNGNHLKLDDLPSPFEAGLVDFSKPLVYYETSRGCPFSCAFCLSSVEGAVRSFGMERIKKDLLFLMGNNVAQIKLVDRTFNYDAARADNIWRFILDHNKNSHFHFEISADLLTDSNIDLLTQVPENTFRFEIGIQSASQTVLEQVKRTADLQRAFTNIRRLLTETKIEIHLDLIAGLPGEGYDDFLASLQTVAALQPHEIQIEPLKLLKGAPMRAIGRDNGYSFSESPPYTLLNNPWLSFADICRIETIGRLLDLFSKHGGFKTAFQAMERHNHLAATLDMMSRQAGNENLSSLSCRRVFELFARLTAHQLPATERQLLHDALFFDFCKSEMPLMGRLPEFVAEQQTCCSWPSRKDLPQGLNALSGSRVKAFRYTFNNDYRDVPWKMGPLSLTFIYISSAGRGQRIEVIPQ